MYLPKQKGTKNQMLIFYEVIPLVFSIFIPVSLLLVKAFLNFSFWNGVKLYCFISFYVLHILSLFSIKWIFTFRNKENIALI